MQSGYWPVALDKPIKNKNRERSTSTSSVGSVDSEQASRPASVELTPDKATRPSTTEPGSSSKLSNLSEQTEDAAWIQNQDWRFGPITKEKAESLLLGKPDGTFLVREQKKNRQYVLGVIHRGKPTHHLISKEGSRFLVNKKSFGEMTDLKTVISILNKPDVLGWPVPLTNPVSGGSANREATEAAEKAKAADAAETAERRRIEEEAAAKRANEEAAAKRTIEEAAAKQAKLKAESEAAAAKQAESEAAAAKQAESEAAAAKQAESEAVAAKQAESNAAVAPIAMKAVEDGKFKEVTRSAAPQLKPEMKLIPKADSKPPSDTTAVTSNIETPKLGKEEIDLNTLFYAADREGHQGLTKGGDGRLTLDEVVTHLDTVALEKFLRNAGTFDLYDLNGDGKIDWKDWFEAADTDMDDQISLAEFVNFFTYSPSSRVIERFKSKADKDFKAMDSDYSGTISRAEFLDAEVKKYEASVTSPSDDEAEQAAAAAAARAVALVTTTVDDSGTQNDKKHTEVSNTTSAGDAQDRSEIVSSRKLTQTVGPIVMSNATTRAVVEAGDALPAWFYGAMSREDAELVMTKHSAKNGDFLVRTKDLDTGEFVLTVIYRKKCTHHNLSRNRDKGSFTINKNLSCGYADTLAGVVDYLSKPVQGWPVKLRHGIVEEGHIAGSEWPIGRGPLTRGDSESKKHRSSPTSVVNAPSLGQRPHHPETSDDLNVSPVTVLPIQPPKVKVTDSNYSATIVESSTKERDAFEQRLEMISQAERKAIAATDRKLMKSLAALPEQNQLLEQYRITATLAMEEHAEAIRALSTVMVVEMNLDAPSYLWDKLSQTESVELLSGSRNGTFLVRREEVRIDDRFSLDMMADGKIAFYSIKLLDSGTYMIDGDTYSSLAFTTLDDLIFALRSSNEKWTTSLTEPIINPARSKSRCPGSGSGETDPESPSYLFTKLLKRQAAEDLLVGPVGTFLLRQKQNSPGQFLLMLRFEGQLTQHLIKRGDDGVYTVNGCVMGNATSLDAQIEYLSSPRDNWPVGLTNPIRPPGSIAPEPTLSHSTEKLAAAEAALANAVAMVDVTKKRVNAASNGKLFTPPPELVIGLRNIDRRAAINVLQHAEDQYREAQSAFAELQNMAAAGVVLPGKYREADPNNPSYLWDGLSKKDAEAGCQGLPDGTFVLRRRRGLPSSFNMTVVFQGQMTHHAVDPGPDGLYTVNGKIMGGKSTLADLISYLSVQDRTGWPVPLSNPIRDPEKPPPISEALMVASEDVATCEARVTEARRKLREVDPQTPGRSRKAKSGGLPVEEADALVAVSKVLTTMAKRETSEVIDAYERVMRAKLPFLGEEHFDILITIIEKKVNEKLAASRAGSAIALAAADLLVQTKHANAVHQLMSNHNELVCSLYTPTKKSEIRVFMGKYLTRISKRIAKCSQDYVASKTALESNKIPEKVSSLETKVDNAALRYDALKHEEAETELIAKNEHLLSFFTMGVSHLTGVLEHLARLYSGKDTSPQRGLSWAFGYLPIPENILLDSAGQCLLENGLLQDNMQVIAEDTMRLAAIRFQEQIQLLQPSEAGRLGEWIAKPIVRALTSAPSGILTINLTAGPDGVGIAFITEHSGLHVVSRISPDGTASAAGLHHNDTLLMIGSTSTASLSHEQVAKLLSVSNSNLTLKVSRTKDIEPPKKNIGLPKYFLRAIDRYDETNIKGPSNDTGLVDSKLSQFNHGMSRDLLGGPLHWAVALAPVPAGDLVRGAGLRVTSNDEDVIYYSASEPVNPGEFGYRHQPPSCPSLYASVEEEIRELGWTNVISGTAPGAEGADNLYSTEGLEDSRLSRPGSRLSNVSYPDQLELLARQKTMEAESLAIEVLHLQREVMTLQGQLSEVGGPLRSGSPLSDNRLSPESSRIEQSLAPRHSLPLKAQRNTVGPPPGFTSSLKAGFRKLVKGSAA